ncbi:MAG: ABC transporter substrate-binding protein [Acidimicrobiales bacterium]
MRTRHLAVIGAAIAVLAGCSSTTTDNGSGSGGTSNSIDPSECGLAALKKASSPVEITMWHTQAEVDATNLQALANTFNSSQDKVRVKLVQQPDYVGEMQKWQAGLTTGDLPDVAQMEDTTVQRLVDSKSTVPVAACVKADSFDLSDFSKRSLEFYTAGGQLQSMAWSVSNVALFYNKADFRKAGLDPDKPPTTLAEVEAASKQLVDSGTTPHGLALRIAPYFHEFWAAKAGQTLVNHDNGRSGRATKAEIDTPTGRKLWTWWKHMVDTGLAVNIGSDQTTIDHFLAVGNHQAAMTIEGNANLSRINAALSSGGWKDVEIAVAPLPGLTSASGGVPIGDGSLWIAKASAPAKRAAAWQWIKFLVSKDAQVTWHTEKGSVPTRASVGLDPKVAALWQQQPDYAVGWKQLQQGPLDAATSGSLIGPYQEVRNAITNGITAMLTNGESPEAALKKAQADADAAIKDYNTRIGA